MPIERSVPSASLGEILERVLDKGLVIEMGEASARLSLHGLDLLSVEADVVQASLARPASTIRVVSVAETEPSVPAPAALPAWKRSETRRRGAA